MTYNLRPAAQRVLTVKQEQLLQAGKRLEGDDPTRPQKTFKNGRKGHTGSVLNPWRTGKSQVKRLVRDKDGVRYTNDEGSATAKGLPPVTKQVDNSGDCVGGDYEWSYQAGRTGMAEMEEKCPGADYQPNMVYRPETREWMDMSPAAVEWVTCDGHQVAKPSQDLRRKARPEGVGATDKQWADQLKTPVTAQAKPIAHDDNGWYEVERVEGFEPATTKERDAALAEQIKVHGSGYRARHARQCKAWETKQMSWKQLTNVVRGATSWVSLDEKPENTDNVEPAWTPTTADRMTELAEAAEAYECQQLMRRILARMSDKQREAIEAKALGKTLSSAQRTHLERARQKATTK